MSVGSQTRPDPTERLRSALGALPGVSAAAVSVDHGGPPRVRVWLDGTQPVEVVSEQVRRLVRTDKGVPSGDQEAKPSMDRKTGLGKGLDALIPGAHGGPPPAHLQPLTPLREATGPLRLDRVSIEETAGRVTVKAFDSVGRTAEAHVQGTEPGLNSAIVSAVSGIMGESAPPDLLAAEVREVAGLSVLIAVLELADGVKAVGAAAVGPGMPFTLGKAVWTAIEEARA